MSRLDCTTPNGRRFIEFQNEAVDRFARVNGLSYLVTHNEHPADIDAVFAKGNVVECVAEVKARSMTLEQLMDYGSYLITADKLDRGVEVARALCVPFLVVVYLLASGHLVWWQITNGNGDWLVIPTRLTTTTKATCNGGQVARVNAYLPMNLGHIL